VRISRAHWLECPFNKVAPFGQRPRTLRPFELGSDTFVLIVDGHSHHVRIAEDVVLVYGCQMMHEANQLSLSEGPERPASGAMGNDQMPAR
jgi:hypothetical protein